ncbi:retinal guanylyl cyclase 2 [Patella vulgata]|uniref:retinal guanylyl cyclase 2 n=1 Tax=Patella vulgata TaxID=6465 RepID=UPI0024A94BCB|nr:retinal guanylyl cyclase 2 [Patella vulgata]
MMLGDDVIRNEDIKLDWDFKYSLVIDLVRGLRYLHNSSLKWHGYLKSTNCVIDSRWVLKLTDYGLPGFLGRAKQIREQDTLDLLWTAPEYLRLEGNQIHKGSEKGDVYSFAIIMQEVALRSDPYSTTGLAPKEIFRKLKKPPPLIRPSVSPQFAPPPYIQLMKQCWSEAPDMRPGVEEIYDQFKKITSGKKANIVDTMFRMLEKYSNDLEEIVNDRTVQLEEEKKKTDQLLSRMLPPAVAEYLKSGKPVEAETFAEVTIYFSDIVGFTTISAMSTPMQVVDLLNDLYTMFDATIEQYDVYKVETIGDAYMVVSGLPTRIGYKHAGEISTMALDLLSQCGTFKIRHMPDVPLRLRIGLHTGSCVAGVVGLTMPRYCLFGDTVNTASRMESTGSAFRIHVSEETKEVLYVLGGYKLEFRGMTDLKGKGKRPTYWLTGKEGFTKPLPDPPDLSADSHGLASVLSSDSLSTMFNNDTTLPAMDRPEPILESNEEEANNSFRISPDQEQTSVNFENKSDKEETSSSKDKSNTNTPKKSSAVSTKASSPKPETKNITKRPNTPKSRPKSSDLKNSTVSEIPLKNIVKAEVTVEKRPTEKQTDQNDKLVNDRSMKHKSPNKVKSEHSSSDTSIAKTAASDRSSSSTQSLSDLTKNNTNNNNNNNNNAQLNAPASISSTNSYPNIPKTDKSRPRTPTNTGGEKASTEPRKLEIVCGKTGPHEDMKNGKSCPEMQPNHVDDVIKSNPKPQNSPGKHSVKHAVKHDIKNTSDDVIVNSGEVVNKSCDAVQKNDEDCAEQRCSDITVVSVLSASDIDINADKLEKSPNDIKLKQQQKKIDSSRLPPITQL